MSNLQGAEQKPHVIYDGLDTTQNHPNVHGDPFFGVYAKPVIEPHKFSERKNYTWKSDTSVTGSSSPVKFTLPVEQKDLESLKESLSRQDILLFNSGMIRAVLDSQETFIGVSKHEISKAILEGFQSPQGAVFAALSSMAGLTKPALSKTLITEETEVSRLAVITYGMRTQGTEGSRGFCISAQEFRVGDFASNPLNADEIKAIPYLSGIYDEVYAHAGLDQADVHAPHAASIAKKFQDAGFPVLATAFAKKNNLELQVERPARKHDLDDGPGF